MLIFTNIIMKEAPYSKVSFQIFPPSFPRTFLEISRELRQNSLPPVKIRVNLTTRFEPLQTFSLERLDFETIRFVSLIEI